MRRQLSSHFYSGIQQGPVPLSASLVDLLELHEYPDVICSQSQMCPDTIRELKSPLLVIPYGMPLPCMCQLGPQSWKHFSFHIIAPPLDPHLRPFTPFSSNPTFFHLFLFTSWIIHFTTWRFTSMSCNSIAGPQELRRCCLSEVGYEPDWSVFSYHCVCEPGPQGLFSNPVNTC